MLAWILEVAGYNPSFLIGGVVEGFSVSSRLTGSNFFVIEADGVQHKWRKVHFAYCAHPIDSN
jgi:UDP-N-acetylmuramate-alanine ligase